MARESRVWRPAKPKKGRLGKTCGQFSTYCFTVGIDPGVARFVPIALPPKQTPLLLSEKTRCCNARPSLLQRFSSSAHRAFPTSPRPLGQATTKDGNQTPRTRREHKRQPPQGPARQERSPLPGPKDAGAVSSHQPLSRHSPHPRYHITGKGLSPAWTHRRQVPPPPLSQRAGSNPPGP